MRSRAPAILATCLLALASSACSSARRSEPLTGGLVPSSAALERGERVFYEHCNQCHTGGEAALGPALNNKPLPAFLLRFQVRRGLGAMPAFSEAQIDDGELKDLVAYVTELRHEGR